MIAWYVKLDKHHLNLSLEIADFCLASLEIRLVRRKPIALS